MIAMAYSPVSTVESEAGVIARGLRRRDPDLLNCLIERYQHRLLRYLVYLSGDSELAKDLSQETLIRVLERGHQYNGKHEFNIWLYTVARNLTLDQLRKKRPMSLNALMDKEDGSPFEPVDIAPLAWEVVAQHEQANRIRTALLGIPIQYREAVVLRFQEELALEELATVIGVPLGTVKSRLSRGLSMLVEQLKGA